MQWRQDYDTQTHHLPRLCSLKGFASQGVGFRWRARHAADLYGCTGWVRNEWDGTVVMEIQGEEENIDQVIRSIEAGRYVTIERMNVKTIPIEEERGFRAR